MISALLIAVFLSAEPAAGYSGVIWYHADGCTACKEMEPTVNRLIVEGQPIIVEKIPFTREAFRAAGITKVPATKAYRNGGNIHLNYGVLDEAWIRSIIQRTKG
jgi:hypothetical protein